MSLKTLYTSGWIELLFLKQGAALPTSPELLCSSDYERHGGRIALAEFETTFEVYEFFSDADKPLRPGVPRYLQSYDIINVEIVSPKSAKLSYVLLEASKRVPYLFPGCAVDTLPARPLQLAALRNFFNYE